MSELKGELEKRGWKLVRIKRFKHHDRIVIQNSQLDVSANLRGHTEDYSLEQIVSALTRGEGS